MIKINERFYINADNNCYKLQEKTTVQDKDSKNYGQEVFKDLGYYTTIEGCLNGTLKIELREFISRNEENTLQDLLKEIQNVKDNIKTALKGGTKNEYTKDI